MGSAKRQNSSAPAWLALAVLASLCVIGGGWYLVWRWLGPRIRHAPERRIAAEQVEVTPPPEWIHSDVRGEVFRDPVLDGPLWIMDDDLVERIANAFSRHPWVAKVVRVTKRPPASVRVELLYRRPVCMVKVPGGLLPVDGEGILLPPEDFSPTEAAHYPQVTGVDRTPAGPPGSRWSDAKVLGGAEIVIALGSAWQSMQFQRIVPLPADPATQTPSDANRRAEPADAGRRLSEPFFAMVTRGGTRVLWGHAPGANALGELSAAEKVARLQRYLANHDTLEGRDGKPQELDVRNLRTE
jgi:hypothetical protein